MYGPNFGSYGSGSHYGNYSYDYSSNSIYRCGNSYHSNINWQNYQGKGPKVMSSTGGSTGSTYGTNSGVFRSKNQRNNSKNFVGKGNTKNLPKYTASQNGANVAMANPNGGRHNGTETSTSAGSIDTASGPPTNESRNNSFVGPNKPLVSPAIGNSSSAAVSSFPSSSSSTRIGRSIPVYEPDWKVVEPPNISKSMNSTCPNSAGKSNTPRPPPVSLKVISYNVLADGSRGAMSYKHSYCVEALRVWKDEHYSHPFYNAKKRNLRLHRVVQRLLEFDADIICLQECWKHFFHDFMALDNISVIDRKTGEETMHSFSDLFAGYYVADFLREGEKSKVKRQDEMDNVVLIRKSLLTEGIIELERVRSYIYRGNLTEGRHIGKNRRKLTSLDESCMFLRIILNVPMEKDDVQDVSACVDVQAAAAETQVSQTQYQISNETTQNENGTQIVESSSGVVDAESSTQNGASNSPSNRPSNLEENSQKQHKETLPEAKILFEIAKTAETRIESSDPIQKAKKRKIKRVPVLVGNTHLFWDPRFPQAKASQAELFVNLAAKECSIWKEESADVEGDHIHMILCGDLNTICNFQPRFCFGPFGLPVNGVPEDVIDQYSGYPGYPVYARHGFSQKHGYASRCYPAHGFHGYAHAHHTQMKIPHWKKKHWAQQEWAQYKASTYQNGMNAMYNGYMMDTSWAKNKAYAKHFSANFWNKRFDKWRQPPISDETFQQLCIPEGADAARPSGKHHEYYSFFEDKLKCLQSSPVPVDSVLSLQNDAEKIEDQENDDIVDVENDFDSSKICIENHTQSCPDILLKSLPSLIQPTAEERDFSNDKSPSDDRPLKKPDKKQRKASSKKKSALSPVAIEGRFNVDPQIVSNPDSTISTDISAVSTSTSGSESFIEDPSGDSSTTWQASSSGNTTTRWENSHNRWGNRNAGKSAHHHQHKARPHKQEKPNAHKQATEKDKPKLTADLLSKRVLSGGFQLYSCGILPSYHPEHPDSFGKIPGEFEHYAPNMKKPSVMGPMVLVTGPLKHAYSGNPPARTTKVPEFEGWLDHIWYTTYNVKQKAVVQHIGSLAPEESAGAPEKSVATQGSLATVGVTTKPLTSKRNTKVAGAYSAPNMGNPLSSSPNSATSGFLLSNSAGNFSKKDNIASKNFLGSATMGTVLTVNGMMEPVGNHNNASGVDFHVNHLLKPTLVTRGTSILEPQADDVDGDYGEIYPEEVKSGVSEDANPVWSVEDRSVESGPEKVRIQKVNHWNRIPALNRLGSDNSSSSASFNATPGKEKTLPERVSLLDDSTNPLPATVRTASDELKLGTVIGTAAAIGTASSVAIDGNLISNEDAPEESRPSFMKENVEKVKVNHWDSIRALTRQQSDFSSSSASSSAAPGKERVTLLDDIEVPSSTKILAVSDPLGPPGMSMTMGMAATVGMAPAPVDGNLISNEDTTQAARISFMKEHTSQRSSMMNEEILKDTPAVPTAPDTMRADPEQLKIRDSLISEKMDECVGPKVGDSVLLTKVNESNDSRPSENVQLSEMIQTGFLAIADLNPAFLPSANEPSDHLPVGAIFGFM